MFDVIVVPLDLSPASLRAIDTSVRIARAFTAPIELVTVSELAGIDQLPTAAELQRVADGIDAPTRPVVVLASNDVGDALTAHVHALQRPLVCMATHGRTALTATVLGSTARALVDAGLPVVLVGPRCVAPERIADVVVAMPPGDDAGANACIAEARSWAEATGARIHPLAGDCAVILAEAEERGAAVIIAAGRPLGRKLAHRATCPVLAVPLSSSGEGGPP